MEKFDLVIDSFSEHKMLLKAQRIEYFLRGFNYRLDGLYDKALENILKAYEKGGDGDYHILRELSHLYMSTGNISEAENYIKKAKQKPYMRSNNYIIDIEIKIELSKGREYVKHSSEYIETLIDKLGESENGDKTFYHLNKIGYELALGNTDKALSLIDNSNKENSYSFKLVKAKALIKNRKYKQAEDILIYLKKDIFNKKNGQRRSILPVIIELLIEAVSFRSIEEAIELLGKDQKFIPNGVIAGIRRYITGGLRPQQKLTSKQREILNI